MTNLRFAANRVVRNLGRLINVARRARRKGTLSLDGLSPPVVRTSRLALLAILVSVAAFSAFLGLDWWPGPVLRVPGILLAEGLPGRLSLPALVLGVVAMAVAATAGAVAFVRSEHSWLRHSGFVALAFAALVIGAAVAGSASVIASLGSQYGWLARALGFLGLGAAFLLLARPTRLGRRTWFVGGLAAVPLIAVLLLIGAVADTKLTLTLDALDPRWPRVVGGPALAAGTLAAVAALSRDLLGLVFVWQAVKAARGLRRRAAKVLGRSVGRRTPILAALLTAKAVWMIATLVGIPPTAVGATGVGYHVLGNQSPGALIAGLMIALAIGAWLTGRSPRRRLSERGIGPAAAILVATFEAFFVLAGIVLLLLPALGLLDEVLGNPPVGNTLLDCNAATQPGLEATGLCLDRRLSDLIDLGPWLSVVAAGVLAILLSRRRSTRPIAIVLLVALAWILPHKLVGVDLATVDFFLTLVVAVLAALWWAGRQQRVGPQALGVVLVTSTLVAQSGSLVPPFGIALVIGALFAIGIAYELLFGSRELNDAGARRESAVPAALALELGALGAALLAVAYDAYRPDPADLAELYLPPVIALLIGAQLSRWRPESPSHVTGRVTARNAVFSLGAATMAVAFLVASPGFATSPGDGPPATTAEAYAEFVAHVDSARFELASEWVAALNNRSEASRRQMDVMVLARLTATQRDWLSAHDARAC
jgi:hypothetical protein